MIQNSVENATIYSKDNLQIEGKGILNIAAEFEKGIFTENGLDIRGGIINIKSKDDAIRGNDSVEISGGTLNLVCGGDGIRTNEEAEKGKGFISIDGAAINIESELDAIEAVTDLKINGGEITAKSGSGATGEFSLTENFPVNGRDFFRPDKNESQGEGLTITDEEAASQKGIKAGNSLMIEGGTLSLSSADDSLHGADITIEGGSFTLSSDNNAIYADNTLTVNGGNITVESSYEGLKATEIAVNGGYTLINADGNGLNSNSKALLKGGTVIIYGPENKGTSALDYSGSFTVSGGTLLATDSRNITQFVIGEGIRVLNINASSAANTISAITDQEGNCLVAFKSQKAFKNVIFASENIKDDAFYSFYSGGTINCEHNKKNGFCLDAEYTPGQLISNIY